MTGVIPDGDRSLSQIINEMYATSNETVTKRQLASVLAAVFACVEGINTAYLASTYEFGGHEWREAVAQWHKSRDGMFDAVKESLVIMAGDNGE